MFHCLLWLWLVLLISACFYIPCRNAVTLKTETATEPDTSVINATSVSQLNHVNNSNHMNHLCDDALVHCFRRYINLSTDSCGAIRSKLNLLRTKRQSNLFHTAEFEKVFNTFSEKSGCHRRVYNRGLGPPTGCAEAVLRAPNKKSGIYKIQPDPFAAPFYVYCKTDDRDGGDAWTVVQRRQNGVIDFDRNWHEYQRGFGNKLGEFFIGLDNLHAMTENKLQELWVYLEDFKNATCSARYSVFGIGDKQQVYALNILGEYSGDCGDALRYHEGMKFSTKDANNDASEHNCAEMNQGGWWYNKCQECNLNSVYLKGSVVTKDEDGRGVVWRTWRNHDKSLKTALMAIRPVK